MPFEEIQHTADWSIRVWAKDLPTLFSEAALGFLSISGIILARSGEIIKEIKIRSPDPESLLVAFLSDLIFFADHEQIAFDKITIGIKDDLLVVHLVGGPIKEINKIIKAVTFHNLKINKSTSGVDTEIVFDV